MAFLMFHPSATRLEVRFEVFTVGKNQVELFWVMMPCSVVEYQCFRGPCCLCHQGEVVSSWWM